MDRAFREFMANPGGTVASRGAQVTMLAQALGTTPQGLMELWRPIKLAADMEAKRLKEGGGTVEEYESAAKALGRGDLVGRAAEEFITGGKKGKGVDVGKLADTLSGSLDAFLDMPDISSNMQKMAKGLADAVNKQAELAKEKDLAQSTRSTADIFAAAFEYLFNKIFGVVSEIADGLSYLFHGRNRYAKGEEIRGIETEIGTPEHPGILRTDLDKLRDERENMERNITLAQEQLASEEASGKLPKAVLVAHRQQLLRQRQGLGEIDEAIREGEKRVQEGSGRITLESDVEAFKKDETYMRGIAEQYKGLYHPATTPGGIATTPAAKDIDRTATQEPATAAPNVSINTTTQVGSFSVAGGQNALPSSAGETSSPIFPNISAPFNALSKNGVSTSAADAYRWRTAVAGGR
jgi:hypothetical protein